MVADVVPTGAAYAAGVSHLDRDRPLDDAQLADVSDFVDQYECDAARGVDRPLDEWLRRFPNSQAEVAAEWLALRQPSDRPAQAASLEAPDRTDHPRVGPYELLRELGRGGQGTVYLARDTRLRREVALKILSGGFDALASSRVERLRREAEVVARLDHPSLCGILDADLSAQPPWLAMHLVQGETLAAALTRARTEGAAQLGGLELPPHNATQVRAVCALFERTARALHAAHVAGVVHRDVKPGNIMVDASGRPVVLDFGVAEDRTSDRQLTMEGDVHGTPDYMAPEQVEARRDLVGPRTDVWALACSLHEALTLQRLWARPALAATFEAIRSEPAPLASAKNAAVSRDLDIVLATALEKDPARRYASALDFAEDLRRVREFEPIHARPAGPWLRFVRWMRRNPRTAAATVGGFVALSIGLLVALQLLARERDALSNSLGRHLTQRTTMLVTEDSARAHLLGVEAVERAPNWLSRGALSRALESSCLERRFVQAPPARTCTSLAVHPQGTLCAMVFDDGTLRLVRLTDGVELAGRRLDTVPRCVAFHHDAPELALGLGSSVVLVSTHDLSEQRRFEMGSEVERIAHDTTRWLVAAGAWYALDGEARQPLASLRGRARAIQSNGTHTLLVDDHAQVLQGSALATEVEACSAASLSSNGKRLAVAAPDGTLRVLEQRNAQDSDSWSLIGTTRLDPPAHALAFASHGERLVVACKRGEEGRAWVVDVQSMTLVPLPGHQGRAVQALCVTVDGDRVWTAGADTSLCLADVTTGKELLRSWSPTRALELLPTLDGQRIVERGAGALVQVHYAGSRPDALLLSGHRGAVRLAGFAGAGSDQTIHSVDTTGETRVYSAGSSQMLAPQLLAVHGGGSVLRAAARDVGRTALATLTADGKVSVVSLATGALVLERTESLAEVQHLDLSAHGQTVVAVNAQAVQVWTAGAPSKMLDTAPAQRAYLDASGLHVLCLGRGNRAEVVELATGMKRGVLEWTARSGAHGAHTAVAVPQGGWALYCADGKVRFPSSAGTEWRDAIAVFEVATLRIAERGTPLLLVGRFGGRALRLQDLSTGNSTWPHARPTASIVDADLDASGTTVAAVANDGSLTISAARDGTPWMERNLSGAAATTCALSADGGRVLVGGSDGLVRIYDKDPLPAALRRLPRKLDGWEVELEQGLAAPLRFEPRTQR